MVCCAKYVVTGKTKGKTGQHHCWGQLYRMVHEVKALADEKMIRPLLWLKFTECGILVTNRDSWKFRIM